MADAFTYQVEGLRNISRAVAESDDALNTWMRDGLQEIGERVAVDIRSVFRNYSEIGAAGVKTKITKPGNVVDVQTLRRGRNVNRRRSNFGGLMMRKAFLPALAKHEHGVESSVKDLFADLERVWK